MKSHVDPRNGHVERTTGMSPECVMVQHMQRQGEDSFQSDEAGIIEPIFFLKYFLTTIRHMGNFFSPTRN